MTHLLHLDASAGSASTSLSRALAATWRSAWSRADPTSTVTHRDLATDPIPHVSALQHEIAVAVASGQPLPERPNPSAALRLQEQLLAELLAASAVLISTPMYNYGLPAALKAWVDQIAVVGRTIMPTGHPRPLQGRPITVISTRGATYPPGGPAAARDHVTGYLHTLLVDTLGMDLTLMPVDSTLAARSATPSPAQASAQQRIAAAHREASDLATTLALALRHAPATP